MRLTPLDIHNHDFSTRLRGFDPAEVEAFLRLIAEDYESLLRECDGMRRQIKGLEGRVEELQQSEKSLQATLVTAQSLAEDLKKTAMKEAEVVVSQAELHSERLLDSAQRRAGGLIEDIRQMKQLRSRLAGALRATIETHLGLLEGLATDPPDDPDTRTLEGRLAAMSRTPVAPAPASAAPGAGLEGSSDA